METTLTLDKGITLKGLGDGESIENEDGGIEVVEKGKLIMNEGSKLTNFGNNYLPPNVRPVRDEIPGLVYFFQYHVPTDILSCCGRRFSTDIESLKGFITQ